MKRKALDKVADVPVFPDIPSRKRDRSLPDWLHALRQREGQRSRPTAEDLLRELECDVEFRQHGPRPFKDWNLRYT